MSSMLLLSSPLLSWPSGPWHSLFYQAYNAALTSRPFGSLMTTRDTAIYPTLSCSVWLSLIFSWTSGLFAYPCLRQANRMSMSKDIKAHINRSGPSKHRSGVDLPLWAFFFSLLCQQRPHRFQLYRQLTFHRGLAACIARLVVYVQIEHGMCDYIFVCPPVF